MPRIPLPGPQAMSPEQKYVYDAVVGGARGTMIGPLRAVIHSPDLARRWSDLGEFLRFKTCLPARLNELAIVVTGRRWSSDVEWWVHAQAAARAGISAGVLESIRDRRTPVFTDQAEWDVYEFARQLQMNGTVEQTLYDAVTVRWGVKGVVELAAVVGYYTMVSMTLNVHEIPMPDGVNSGLPQLAGQRLVDLPPASLAQTEGARA